VTATSELHERFVTATSELRDRGGGAWCPRRGRGSDGRGRALKRGAGGIQGKALKRRAGPPYCTIDVCARVHAHPLTRSVGATSFLIFRLHLSLSLSLSLSHTHTHTHTHSLLRFRRDETCPVSTGGGTRRVRLVREEGRDVGSEFRARSAHPPLLRLRPVRTRHISTSRPVCTTAPGHRTFVATNASNGSEGGAAPPSPCKRQRIPRRARRRAACARASRRSAGLVRCDRGRVQSVRATAPGRVQSVRATAPGRVQPVRATAPGRVRPAPRARGAAEGPHRVPRSRRAAGGASASGA